VPTVPYVKGRRPDVEKGKVKHVGMEKGGGGRKTKKVDDELRTQNRSSIGRGEAHMQRRLLDCSRGGMLGGIRSRGKGGRQRP